LSIKAVLDAHNRAAAEEEQREAVREQLSAGGSKMNADMIKRAIECIASGDTSQALEIVKEWIASAAGADDTDAPDPDDEAASAAADDPADDGDADGSEGDGAEGVSEPPKTKKNGLTAQQLRFAKEYGVSPETMLACKRALNRPLAPASDGSAPMAVHGAFGGGGGSDAGGYTMRGGYGPTRR
jgi:hypothetical protein